MSSGSEPATKSKPTPPSEVAEKPGPPKPPPIPPEVLRTALEAIDLSFGDDELALMGIQAAVHRRGFGLVREAPLADVVPPALRFEPRIPGIVGRPGKVPPGKLRLPRARRRPVDVESLAIASIPELAGLVRGRAVSCVELATLSFERLRRLDPILHCVVTLTEDRALAQARALDDELAAARWRGPLHGIPWGAKDLLAVRGYPTTWGTPPYAGQLIDMDATVVTRLDEAGAVLVAKLSLGELAWGDVWTGGRTNNPWDLSEGSSGSSAGSAAAVAAGCVPFAIGSETLGSIMSPSRSCGITGLRPTFGRVSRHGAMALAWSLDKLGPMCRSAEDAAIVFGAIAGPDGIDDTVVNLPFAHPSKVDPRGWRVGVVAAAFEDEPATRGALDELRSLGCELLPVELPPAPLKDLWLIGEAEAATSFDELLRSGRVDEMVRQEDEAWPNVFRAARLIPAVEYLRASRLRRALMLSFDERIRDLDLIVHPAEEDSTLAIENFTGHPAIGLPWGRRANGAPDGIALAAHLDRETDLLGFAIAFQARTDHHRGRPPV